MPFINRLVQVSNIKRSYSARFRTMTAQYDFQFHPNGIRFFNDIESWYLECLNTIVEVITSKTRPDYKIGIRIDIPSLESVKPIYLTFMRCDQISGQMIADRIFMVLQSQDEFKQGEKIVVQATILRTQRVGVRG